MNEERLPPGHGQIKLANDGRDAVFETIRFSYPLKLISPARRYRTGVHGIYVLSYGGGLVAGDRVGLEVEVEGGTTLVMLTQGSTKVFKTRPGRYLTATPLADGTIAHDTRQTLTALINAHSTLVLLPSPVTCFSQANYAQQQDFRLENATSSVLVLDWFTSGRMNMRGRGTGQERATTGVEGEEWAFARYRSSNTIHVAGAQVAKDVLLLQDDHVVDAASTSTSMSPTAPGTSATSPPRHKTSYATHVAPYSVYATILFYGPSFASLHRSLSRSFGTIEQHKLANPYALVWSFSSLGGDGTRPAAGSGSSGVRVGDEVSSGGKNGSQGGIARAAGATTEMVMNWVKAVLKEGGIEEVVSRDLWKTAFS